MTAAKQRSDVLPSRLQALSQIKRHKPNESEIRAFTQFRKKHFTLKCTQNRDFCVVLLSRVFVSFMSGNFVR